MSWPGVRGPDANEGNGGDGPAPSTPYVTVKAYHAAIAEPKLQTNGGPQSAPSYRAPRNDLAWCYGMKFLLTSAGISNKSIHEALVGLLGKPITESSAVFIPTGSYAFPGGVYGAYRLIRGNARTPLCELEWKSLGPAGTRCKVVQIHPETC